MLVGLVGWLQFENNYAEEVSLFIYLDCLALNGRIMNRESEWMWKEAVLI
jgi:hypothetical protein